jgi:hypothetical protein
LINDGKKFGICDRDRKSLMTLTSKWSMVIGSCTYLAHLEETAALFRSQHRRILVTNWDLIEIVGARIRWLLKSAIDRRDQTYFAFKIKDSETNVI